MSKLSGHMVRKMFVRGAVLVGVVAIILAAIYFWGGNASRQFVRNWFDASIKETDSGFLQRGATVCSGSDAEEPEKSDVYVSKAGSDNNQGTKEMPFETIVRALCQIRPGQTVHVAPGTYSESVFLESIGHDNKPIKIVGDVRDNQGGQVIMDGGREKTYGLALNESQNITIENITFQNYTDAGLFVAFSRNIILHGNIFANNGFASIEPDYDGEGFGVHIADSSEILVDKNEAFSNGPGPDRRDGGTLGTGIDTFGNKKVTIKDNNIHDNIGGGVLVEDSEEINVLSNLIEKNDLDVSAYGWWDAGIWVDGGRDVTLSENIIRDNQGPAIEISDEEGSYANDQGGALGYVVKDNQLSRNYFARFVFGYGQCPDPPLDALIWQNNEEDQNVYDQELLPDHTLSGEWLCLE